MKVFTNLQIANKSNREKKNKILSAILCKQIKVLKSILERWSHFIHLAGSYDLYTTHEPTYSISRHSTLGIFSFVIDRS